MEEETKRRWPFCQAGQDNTVITDMEKIPVIPISHNPR